VVLQLDADLPIMLADPDQLDQVFGNLIRNAVQAMPDGGRLTIGTSLGSRQVTVFIADTGVGISEENREKIFEPLFTTKAQGIGLGLAIVKTLVEGHGGTIEVKSPSIVRQAQDTAALRTDDVGKGTEAWALGSGSAQGTTFTVRLPVGISLQEA
jgi:signal transduction histidine kinase